MQVASSIQIPKRLDPKRKQLVKQLQNDIKNIKKQNLSTPKRNSSQDSEDYLNFDTLKKKPHVDSETKRNGKLNHISQKQNDRLFAHKKSYEMPIKPSLNRHINSKTVQQSEEQNDKTVRKDDILPLSHVPALFPLMLDQHIPNFRDNNLEIFTDTQRLLISIQEKLDSFLMFVKENRKKKKGEFFSVIKRSFLQNQRIFLEFSHLKKILFIDSDLYKVQKFGEGFSIDCLIDIKLQSNELDAKGLEKELRDRKNAFPKKLLAAKEELRNNTEQDDPQIPEIRFEFENVAVETKNIMRTSLKNILDGEMMNKKKIDKYFVLQNKESDQYQMAKKVLFTGIKRVETIIKKETEIDLTLFQKKLKQEKQLSSKQIESIIQEINFIYRSKGVTNLLFDSLIESLSKKMIMSLELMAKCIEIFIEIGPKINKNKPILRQINHKNGRILQIERASIDQFRIMVVKKEEFMKMFRFDMQLTTEEVKKKMQEQRIKVFEQVKNTIVDQNYEIKASKVKELLKANNQNLRKVDYSKVRNFEDDFTIQKTQQRSSSSENQKESQQDEGEIGVPRKLYLQTLKILRQDRQIAKKVRKADEQAACKRLQELMKVMQQKKKENHQDNKESTTENNNKEQFKSTLSNSDEISYEDNPSVRENCKD